MAPPSAAQTVQLSPAELSYIHTSLAQTPPIRPDGRTPTQFRPLIAETDILPSTNGSARICFADGTEAVVGVKAEVEKTAAAAGRNVVTGETEQEGARGLGTAASADVDMDDASASAATHGKGKSKGQDAWLDVTVDIPGFRDDDALPVFLSAMLTEALLADGVLRDRLYINTRFHWRLYIDILLLSAPLSYPLPLLSLTTHLALQHTRLPALISEKDEDPLFNDDWAAATPLYLPSTLPPVTLLVMSVADNILYDPSKDELAVADALLAVSVGRRANPNPSASTATDPQPLSLLALRTIDPPSRLTTAGTPRDFNASAASAAGVGLVGPQQTSKAEGIAAREALNASDVWRPPRGGVRRALVARVVKEVLARDGVAEEVLGALRGVRS